MTLKKMLGCIISEKLFWEIVSDAATNYTLAINVLINASKALRGPKNKKGDRNRPPVLLGSPYR